MRFHQALSFLPTTELEAVARLSDELGYAGLYLSDHLLNLRDLSSRYTYSTRDDGAPSWSKGTEWPDPCCVISALSMVARRLTFTTGVYVAPMRDLLTVVKSVGTAAVLSSGRVRLGVGVGWCQEEFDLTGQEFATRGRRLDEMIQALRALWRGGWVEFHGTYYDVPPAQINPSPSHVPIYGGGHSKPALRRAAELCDGWIAAGAYREEEAWAHLRALEEARRQAGRHDEPFAIYLSLAERPHIDLYRRFEDAGVTDMVCAPWMMVSMDGRRPEEVHEARRVAIERFAEEIVSRV